MANMPLTDIGITPRKASQFASKEIETVTDLLGYYPTKYLDFRNRSHRYRHTKQRYYSCGGPRSRRKHQLRALLSDMVQSL